MRKLGRKQLTLQLQHPLACIPEALSGYALSQANDNSDLIYTYDASDSEHDRSGIAALLRDLDKAGIPFKDLNTTQSSLEDIFLTLVKERH